MVPTAISECLQEWQTIKFPEGIHSKKVRRFVQWDPEDIKTLRPLVVPLCCSGHYSPGPLDFYILLNSASNLYLVPLCSCAYMEVKSKATCMTEHVRSKITSYLEYR